MTEDERAIAIVSDWVEKAERFEIPERIAGIYLLYYEREIVYVGQSVNLITRIRSHADEGRKNFDAVGIIRVPLEYLDDVETAFIRVFEPRYNRTLSITQMNNVPRNRVRVTIP